jgi:hypothetical protein
MMFGQQSFERKLATLFQSESPDVEFVNALENRLLQPSSSTSYALDEPLDYQRKVTLWKSVAIGACVLLLLLSFVMGPKTIWASLLDWFEVYLPKVGFSRVASEKGLVLAEKTEFVEKDVRFVFESFYSTSEATFFALDFYDLPVYLNASEVGEMLLNYDDMYVLEVQLSWDKDGEATAISCVPTKGGILGSKHDFDPMARLQNWHVQFECAAIDEGVNQVEFEIQQLPLLLTDKGPEVIRFDLDLKEVDLTELDAVELLEFEVIEK